MDGSAALVYRKDASCGWGNGVGRVSANAVKLQEPPCMTGGADGMRCYWTIPTCSGSSGNYFVEWTAFDIRLGWEQDDRRSAAKAVDLRFLFSSRTVGLF